MQPINVTLRQCGLVKPSSHHSSHRTSRRSFVVHASQTDTYTSPSNRTGATELQALERLSEVVPDVLLSETLQNVEKPKAATVSRNILAGLMANAAGTGRYKFAIEQARYFKSGSVKGADLTALQVDKALTNVGGLMLEGITGRVSVEIDPRSAHDTAKLLARSHQILSLFKEIGVSKDRVLIRMPATWEAIQAAKALEAEGTATHLVSVNSFVQAAAAAQAGVSVVQINVGRLGDWYDKNPGVIRDPNAPREARAIAMAGYGASQANPGILLAEKVWSYCKQAHPKTKVMASGLRSKAETMSLAGCDLLVVGPRVLEALQAASTLEGYNDGMHASADSNVGGLTPRLTPSFAAAYEFEPVELRQVDKTSFNDQLGMAGKELLNEEVKRLVEDANRLEPLFLNQVGGNE